MSKSIKLWEVKIQNPLYQYENWNETVKAKNYKEAGEKAMKAHKGTARYVKRVELIAETTI